MAAEADPPTITVPASYLCLSSTEQAKVSKAILDLEKCNSSLKLKDELIQARLATGGGTPALAFWQEPQFVIGGIVVTASVATLIGFMAGAQSK